MTQRIVVGRPPNYDSIVERIGRPPHNAVFAWGDVLYVPSAAVRAMLDPALLAHEEVHARQQAAAGGPAAWWSRYLADLEFRLAAEVEAYRRQVAVLGVMGVPRKARRAYTRQLAKDLAGPLYGHLVKSEEAHRLIGA